MIKGILACLLFTMPAIALLSQNNVGIGNTNPQYPLDVSGRIRIRGGSDYNSSAGLWLSGNGADAEVKKIFLGMQSDSTAGFYSDKFNIGWGLVFDGRNGNVGIGNQDPSFPLSFKDLSGDKISLYREGGNYYGLGIGSAAMQLITPNSSSDIIFGYGRSAGFTENMRIKGNGRVGIGTANPNATIEAKSNITGIPILRLSGVNEAYQDFYPLGNNGGRYGWLGFSASEPDKFFLYNDRNGDMSFITGGGERLTLKNNGNVGIGITDPAYKLDVGARLRIRSAPGLTAGLWLNNDANNATPAFIGMFSDNQVGFYGSGPAGWGLLVNTQTGAVSFGGNAGQPGQVLTSQGPDGSASWANPGLIIKTGYSGASTDIQLPATGSVELTSSQYSITLNRAARIILQYKTRTFKPCSLGSCNTKWAFTIFLNGNFTQTFFVDGTSYHILPGSTQGVSSGSFGPDYFDLGPGTHTFTFRAYDSFNQPKIEFFQVLSTILEQ